MRGLRQFVWTGAIAVLTAGPALAQLGGTSGGTTGGFGGSTGGFGGTSGGGFGGSGGGQGGGLSGNSNPNQLGTQLQQSIPPPNISAPSSLTNTSSNTAINATNFLRSSYANPYYAGFRTNAINTNFAPGGFGAASFGSSTTGGGQIGFAGGTGGVGATAGRGAAGAGGTGSINNSDPSGVIVPLPRAIAYTAQVKFAAPPAMPAQVMADLRGTIDRSNMIANPAGVQVLMDGNAVVLRGHVRDDEEARLVEGMVRLTPGVREIRNELAYPRP